MSSFKYLLNFILSVFLCFFVIILILTSVLIPVLTSKTTYINILEKAKISDIIHTQIQDNFIDQSGGSLIPEEVFDGVMPKEQVEKIFSSYVSDALDFVFSKTDEIQTVEFDFSLLEKNLTDFFTQYATEHSFAIDEAFEEQLKLTIENAKQSIETAFDFSLFKKVAQLVKPYAQKYGVILKLLPIGVLLVCAAIYLFIFLSDKKSSLYWLFSSFACGSAVIFLGFLVLRVSGFFEKFILENPIIKALVSQFLFTVTDTVLIGSCIVLVLSLILLILKIKRQSIYNIA